MNKNEMERTIRKREQELWNRIKEDKSYRNQAETHRGKVRATKWVNKSRAKWCSVWDLMNDLGISRHD